jgi:hypothetical protein
VKKVCKILVLLLAASSLICGAQSGSVVATSPLKLKKFSGNVRPDGQSILCAGNHLFMVSNPEILNGHLGHFVSVRGTLDPLTHQLKIASLKVIQTQTHYATNLGDAAFRR